MDEKQLDAAQVELDVEAASLATANQLLSVKTELAALTSELNIVIRQRPFSPARVVELRNKITGLNAAADQLKEMSAELFPETK